MCCEDGKHFWVDQAKLSLLKCAHVFCCLVHVLDAVNKLARKVCNAYRIQGQPSSLALPAYMVFPVAWDTATIVLA